MGEMFENGKGGNLRKWKSVGNVGKCGCVLKCMGEYNDIIMCHKFVGAGLCIYRFKQRR